MSLSRDMCTRLGIDNPWHSPFKQLPFDPHGWFGSDNREGLKRIKAAKGEIRYCLELGPWLGASTRFLAEICELVVAVDHWEGSPEHHMPHRTDVKDRLPILYQQFMSNCMAQSVKILPLKMSTTAAFSLFREKDMQRTFDLIYVDAGHDTRSVRRDLTDSMDMITEEGGSSVVMIGPGGGRTPLFAQLSSKSPECGHSTSKRTATSGAS